MPRPLGRAELRAESDLWTHDGLVGFFVAAAVLVVFAAGQWFLTKPAVGDINRAVFKPFLGERAKANRGWFKTDARGVYVNQRFLAYVYLGAAVICLWIGLLAVLIG